jgi:hypothetical protein
MRLACRKCGREYEVSAELRARGIYQITCSACGQMMAAEGGAERLRQAGGMIPTPIPRAQAVPVSKGPPPIPRVPDGEYVDLTIDDITFERVEGSTLDASAPPILPSVPEPAAGIEAPPARAPEAAPSSRALLVAVGVAVLLAAVAGTVFVARGRPGPAVPRAPGAEPGTRSITTVAPALAPADPEAARAEEARGSRGSPVDGTGRRAE